MSINRIELTVAQSRLALLPKLAEILGSGWLAQDFAKPEDQWSLITGWLTVESNEYWQWLKDLDAALAYLQGKLTPNALKTIERKIKVHSDRANSKGLLSEIAICVFLAAHNIKIELERSLIEGSEKDVDIQATIPDANPVYIEVQWLSPSDESERGAAVAAAYDDAYPIHYGNEKVRIKGKLFTKTRKFTPDDVTMVALDCTTAPELGGSGQFSVIEEMLTETCEGIDMNGKPWPYYDSESDKAIRKYMDGVIWFELQPGESLMPHTRGVYLNPASPHKSNEAMLSLAALWLAPGNPEKAI